MTFEINYLNNDDDRWPPTRGNHTDEHAITRVNELPECVREYMWTNDPCWSYVPTGWVDLVTKLHNHLVMVAPEYRINQIKEKFGQLRFYTNIGFDPDGIAHIIISHYERLSEVTCDVCGEPGKIVSDDRHEYPYVASRCKNHYEEKRARAR